MKLLFHCSQNPPIKLEEKVISPLKMEDAESDIMEDPSPTPMIGDVPSEHDLSGEESVATLLQVLEEVEEAIDTVAEDVP